MSCKCSAPGELMLQSPGRLAWTHSHSEVAVRVLLFFDRRACNIIVFALSPDADVLTTGAWASLHEVRDPELRRLAEALPDTLLQSRASSTTTKYLRAYERWNRWAGQRAETAAYPVNEVHFALYLQHIGVSTQSKSAAEEAVNVISWVQQLADHPPGSTSPLVRATLAGLQRKLAKPRVRKEPITVEMLSRIIGSLGAAPSLSDIRLAAACLLAFAAFLRYDDLAKLRCCDVKFEVSHMTVRITSSKTDQYRQGESVMVARTGTATCPVAMLERYVAAAGIALSSSLQLFRGIVSTKQGERLQASGSLGYARMCELLLAKLEQLGYDKGQFSLHSLRSGGASGAANAGIPDRLFKRHGRWKSETAKDGYVKDSTSALLSVSSSLKL